MAAADNGADCEQSVRTRAFIPEGLLATGLHQAGVLLGRRTRIGTLEECQGDVGSGGG